MKNIFFLALVILACYGCNQPTESVSIVKIPVVDTVPKSELIFVKKFSIADSIFQATKNPRKKKAIADSAKADIEDYVNNHLKLKMDDWIGYVVKVVQLESPAVIEFSIPKKNWIEAESNDSTFSRIKLSLAYNGSSDSASTKAIKTLKPGDRVMIYGEFFSLYHDKFEFDPAMELHDPDQGLLFPTYTALIVRIKKVK